MKSLNPRVESSKTQMVIWCSPEFRERAKAAAKEEEVNFGAFLLEAVERAVERVENGG
jgi:hypothetical protein